MEAASNEKVVYILGAGFSAQFGLPVMSNFLEKSKDMYALRTFRFKDGEIDFFASVYNEIDTLRRCKDFYASDMTNIEEILSLFEMGKMLGSESKQQIDFQNFIAEVIKYYTPTLEKMNECSQKFQAINSFILHIFSRAQENSFSADSELPEYSVLTFNYDRLLENILENCRITKPGSYSYLKFLYDSLPEDRDHIPLIKLHGDVDAPQTIVTPTWKKAFEDSQAKNWQCAGKLLKKANHIRIIGYSLPITDSYLKYFLKWGASQADNLKSIDVICLDDDHHSVEHRYRDFIHHKLNFYNKSTNDYLLEIKNGIEKAHQHLFQKTQHSGVAYSFD